MSESTLEVPKASEEPIKVSDLEPKFVLEISEVQGGQLIKRCLQCNTCTATCPIRRYSREYKPARIIRMAVLGLRKEVLSSDLIWLCASCHSCDERCPRDVKPAEIIMAIREIAVREGYISDAFLNQALNILSFGRVHEITDFENKTRFKMGLPPVPKANVREIRKVVSPRLRKLVKK